jgi:uncharacterized damage-inducible protein DinB
MYRTIADFVKDRNEESAATLQVFNAVRPEALDQRAFANGMSVRELAWHITTALGGVLAQAGLVVDAPSYEDPIPDDFNAIIAAYERSSRSLVENVEKEWNDAQLPDDVTMWGMQFTYGRALSGLNHHEIHHRGEMMTLLRLAGLRVPGIYGPTYEEMEEMKKAMPAEA